ncbi:MAG: hypothetical protein GOU98_04780 [Candidatus Altiarchaeota archaeon]|nr:hypothetical protein [Candidatus Altiarchaeota archaeon]
MKGQLSLEFMVILLLLTAYLSVVFTLFASARANLNEAVDNKILTRTSNWIEFISKRPEGTTIRLDINPPPRRYVSISCGKLTNIVTPSKTVDLKIKSICGNLNFTDQVRLNIESFEEGVKLEVI